jgi:predicted ester cyclase
MRVTANTEDNKAIIRRVFEEFVNKGDFSVVDEIYRDDMIDHQPLPGAPDGLAGVKYTIAGLRGGFPDLQVTIEDMSAHADHVVIHNTWRGTHDGEFLGLAPTGRRISSKGVVVWRLQDGLIAERWGIGVDSNMLVQLGIGKARTSRARVRTTHVPAVRAVPVLPGQAARWRELQREIGSRKAEYEASRKKAEISRERMWLARGDVAVYDLEAPDPTRAAAVLASSAAPFDEWLRRGLVEVHGRDPWAADAAELGHGWER